MRKHLFVMLCVTLSNWLIAVSLMFFFYLYYSQWQAITRQGFPSYVPPEVERFAAKVFLAIDEFYCQKPTVTHWMLTSVRSFSCSKFSSHKGVTSASVASIEEWQCAIIAHLPLTLWIIAKCKKFLKT